MHISQDILDASSNCLGTNELQSIYTKSTAFMHGEMGSVDVSAPGAAGSNVRATGRVSARFKHIYILLTVRNFR